MTRLKALFQKHTAYIADEPHCYIQSSSNLSHKISI